MSLVVAAVVVSAASVYQGIEAHVANKEQKRINNINIANAEEAAKRAEQDFNRANQRKPDTLAILSAAQQAGKGGVSGTMLTGPQGVSDSLLLGKTSLLGA